MIKKIIMKKNAITCVVLGFNIMLGACLMIYGMGWGLPSKERNSIYFETKEDLDDSLADITADMIKSSMSKWPRSGVGIRKDYPRSIFNPIRSYHADEYWIFKKLSNMDPKKLDFNPRDLSHPGLPIYLTGIALKAASSCGFITLTKDLRYYYINPQEFARFYMVGRCVSLVSGLLTILFVWKLGQSFFGNAQGLLASLLISVSGVFIVQAHFMGGYILAMMFMTLAMIGIANILYKSSWVWAIFVGVAIGSAIGCRYLAVIMVIPMFAAYLIRSFSEKRPLYKEPKFILSIIMVPISFIIVNPYALINFRELVTSYQHVTSSLQVGLGDAQNLIFHWFKKPVNFLYQGLGPALASVVLIAVFASIIKPSKQKTLLLLWILPVYVAVGLSNIPHAAYYIFMLPACVVIAAHLLIGFLRKQTKLNLKIKKIIAASVVLISFVVTLSYVNLFGTEDPRLQAGQWIAENVKNNESIGVNTVPWQFYTPPLSRARRIEVVPLNNIRSLEKDNMPEYYVISSGEAETQLNTSLPEAAKDLESLGYVLRQRFEKYPRVLGFNIRRAALFPPVNWYLMPKVWIFKKADT